MIPRYRAPVSIFLNVTYRCNLACVYCSANAGPHARGELTRSEMRQLSEDLVASQVCRVIVTGGEPFARADLFDVLAILRRGRVIVQINTNATLLQRRSCEQLRDLHIDQVSVSLDGPRDANDRTRGAGSFDRVVRGIAHLVAAGIRPNVLLTLNRHNVDGLEAAAEICESLGAASLSVGPVSRIGRARTSIDDVGLSHDQLRSAIAIVRRLQAKYPRFLKAGFLHWADYPQVLAEAQRRDRVRVPVKRLLPCDAAKTFCAITADGWVIPCNKFDGYRCGNIRTEPLLSIWRGEAMDTIRRLAERPVAAPGSACASCRYQSVCSAGCRAEAFRAFGELTAPDPACAILEDAAIHAV